jgi:hypothetical protein
MTRTEFRGYTPVLRLTVAEYESIPAGRPLMLCEQPLGTRWLEIGLGGIVICEFLGVAHDGPLVATYRPVIRVPAVSRLVPRQRVSA